MLLYIDDFKTVGDLHEKFNECFTHLKIEFYDTRHHWGKSSLPEHTINAHTKLDDIRKNHSSGFFEIKSSYKTGKVEQDFRHKFGLFVQVFFLKNNEWVQSVADDDATLAQLNEVSDNP